MPDMIVRPMSPAGRTETRSLVRRCFGHFTMLFFDFGVQTFVCEESGRIIGGIALRAFHLFDVGHFLWVRGQPAERR